MQMLRLVLVSSVLLAVSLGGGSALAGKGKAAVLPHQLTGAEIGSVTGKSLSGMRACYQKHTAKNKKATGKVSVELIVHRDGKPFRVVVKTPGVASKRLTACLTAIAQSWRFPARRGFTKSVVPFLFLRTHVAGAGPAYSCWKAKGCPSKKPAKAPGVKLAKKAAAANPRLSKKAD